MRHGWTELADVFGEEYPLPFLPTSVVGALSSRDDLARRTTAKSSDAPSVRISGFQCRTRLRSGWRSARIPGSLGSLAERSVKAKPRLGRALGGLAFDSTFLGSKAYARHCAGSIRRPDSELILPSTFTKHSGWAVSFRSILGNGTDSLCRRAAPCGHIFCRRSGLCQEQLA